MLMANLKKMKDVLHHFHKVLSLQEWFGVYFPYVYHHGNFLKLNLMSSTAPILIFNLIFI